MNTMKKLFTNHILWKSVVSRSSLRLFFKGSGYRTMYCLRAQDLKPGSPEFVMSPLPVFDFVN